MIDLSGRVAIVTGASRGIGRAIALQLAGQGAVVVAAARGENARPVVDEIVSAGGRAEMVSLDVTAVGAAEPLVAHTLERHSRIDILVNNAGITRDQLLLRMKREDWDAVIATNLTAAFGRRAERECRAGELRGLESRVDWFHEGAGARGRVARHHGERRRAGDDRNGHDTRVDRTGA